jgi:hypothetical protein
MFRLAVPATAAIRRIFSRGAIVKSAKIIFATLRGPEFCSATRLGQFSCCDETALVLDRNLSHYTRRRKK